MSTATILPGLVFERVIAACRREENQRMEDIAQTDCLRPDITRLIEMFGYECLLELLELGDQAFLGLFPALPLGESARRELKGVIVEHYHSCDRCRLIADNHRWADAELDRLIELERAQPKARSARSC